MLPAYAGMIPTCNQWMFSDDGAPRIRGDDPFNTIDGDAALECSPHTRG